MSDTEQSEADTSQARAGTCLRAWFNASKEFVFLDFASVVLLIASIKALDDYGRTNLEWYAFSVALVSLSVCLILKLAEFLKPGSMEKVVSDNPQLGNDVTVRKIFGGFIFLWWAIGAGVITFKDPFTITSNGYFAAWGGLIAAIRWAAPSMLGTAEHWLGELEKGLRFLAGLFVCSVVLVFATIEYLGDHAEAAWGLACGAVTAVVIAFMALVYEKIDVILLRATSIVFIIMWVVAAGVLTFEDPFVITGNGYFAAWIGLFFALLYGLHEMDQSQDPQEEEE